MELTMLVKRRIIMAFLMISALISQNVLLAHTRIVEGATNPSVSLVPSGIIDDDLQSDSRTIYHNGYVKLGQVWTILELWNDLHVPLMWDGYMLNLSTGGDPWYIISIQQIVHETSWALSNSDPSYSC